MILAAEVASQLVWKSAKWLRVYQVGEGVPDAEEERVYLRGRRQELLNHALFAFHVPRLHKRSAAEMQRSQSLILNMRNTRNSTHSFNEPQLIQRRTPAFLIIV
ncbi:hypothetical protein DRO42_07935 [Candidatus Bathyarchaeota archaeon]|nr:MAG: hypothetical protein DRO42_07935 [Candidatus Bathyarchaeota archaeon]